MVEFKNILIESSFDDTIEVLQLEAEVLHQSSMGERIGRGSLRQDKFGNILADLHLNNNELYHHLYPYLSYTVEYVCGVKHATNCKVVLVQRPDYSSIKVNLINQLRNNNML
jgi:hypothetical protein